MGHSHIYRQPQESSERTRECKLNSIRIHRPQICEIMNVNEYICIYMLLSSNCWLYERAVEIFSENNVRKIIIGSEKNGLLFSH